jgi:phospholipid/cholesterol/gamma-HCH transport system substrate-binding protein
MLERGDAIRRTKSVVELGELFNRLGPIVEAIDPAKVNQFLDTIVAALDGNQEKVREALHDLATLTKGLATRDQAIGRLVVNLNDVTGALNSRDAEIRTVLDNLVAISTTFSDNTDVLDQAVTELGDFSGNLGKLLVDNRVHIDGAVDSLTTLLDLVRTKLPELDSAVANLDDASRSIFNASRYGQWLNQTIPCGAVTSPDGTRHDITAAGCVLHGPDGQTGATSPAPTAGAAGLSQLFGQVLR